MDTVARRVADRVMSDLAGLLIHVFFRRVDVEGAPFVPPGAPLGSG